MGRVIASIALVATVVVTARVLGPAGRGALSLELTLASFMMLISGLGVPIAARIHLPASTDPVPLPDYLALGVVLVLFQAVLCAGLGWLLLPLADVDIGVAEALVLAVYGAAVFTKNIVVAALYALGFSTAGAMGEAAGSLVGLLATLAFVAFDLVTVEQLLMAMTVGLVVQVLLSLWMLSRARLSVRPRYRLESWHRLVRTGLPGVGLALGQVATFRLDRYVVGMILDPAAVGLYSVAATAPETLRLVPQAVGDVLTHRVASGVVSIGEAQRIRRRTVCVVALLAAAGFLLAPAAIRLVLGEAYLPATDTLRVLLLAEVGLASFFLSASVLAAHRRIPAAALVSLVGLVLVTGLDVLLVPRAGIVGAAWASALGYSVMAVLAARSLVGAARSAA